MDKERIFDGLDGEEVANIMKQGDVMHCPAGKIIFRQGASGDMLYIVLSGEIVMYHHNVPISKCVKGDVFGEMAVLSHRPRSASAAAISNSRLLTLSESQLNHIFEQRIAVRILLNIVHVLCGHLETANNDVAMYRERLDLKNAIHEPGESGIASDSVDL